MKTPFALTPTRWIRSRVYWLAGSSALLSSVACSGTTAFADTTPIKIATAAPAPPQEPEPEQKLVSVRDNSVSLSDAIQFSYNESGVLADAIATLESTAQTLKDNSHVTKVRVEGHASEEGSAAHNQRLSVLRARAVRAFLIARGVAARRLTTKGYGETQPVADNDTESGREQNRRVEFKVLKQSPTRERIETDPATGEVTVLETLGEE